MNIDVFSEELFSLSEKYRERKNAVGQIIVVTSLKGGVGKTTVSASLAWHFAKMGKRTLAVDMDLGTGGLDIALGREDTVGATVVDVLTGRISLSSALIPGDDDVYFMSAPVFFSEASLDEVTQENFNSLLSALREGFDYCIFDMPAGGGAAFRFFEASGMVDQTFIVTTSSPTAVRAAERCAMRLNGFESIKLILNSYRLSKPSDNTFGIVEVINRTSVPIAGVVPFDSMAEKALAKGKPLACIKNSAAGIACENIARRIDGENILLLNGVLKKQRRRKFY